MEDIIYFLLELVVALDALGALQADVWRRPPTIKQNTRQCLNCENPMSLRRVPIFQSPGFKVQWMCLHCGNRTKSAKGIVGDGDVIRRAKLGVVAVLALGVLLWVFIQPFAAAHQLEMEGKEKIVE
jgi:hypothetical protein